MGSVENEQAAGSAAPPPGFNRYASASTCTSVTSVTHSDTLTQVKERLQKLPNRLSTETFPEEEKKNHVDTRYSASSSGSQCSRDPPMPTTSSTTTELLLQGVPPAAGSLGPQSGARRKETDTMEEVRFIAVKRLTQFINVFETFFLYRRGMKMKVGCRGESSGHAMGLGKRAGFNNACTQNVFYLF